MKIYKYIQVLSLDVVIGACISSLYLAQLFGTILPIVVVAALGISVWLIYTADHLWDARKNETPSTFRHSFHQKNFKLLTIIWSIVAVGGFALLFYLPIGVLKYGGILLGTVLVYFLLLHSFRAKRILYKEISIAFIYSAGLFVAPLALADDVNVINWEWLFMVYLLLSIVNVFLFALYDEAIDRKDGHNSIVIVMGNKLVMFLSIVLWAAGVLTLLFFASDISLHYIFIVMYLLLGSLFIFPRIYSPNDRYRIIGDGIFMLPLFPLLL